MKILKIFIYILLAGALAGAGYFGWNFYTKAKSPIIDALYILPNDAAVVIGFNDYNMFNTEIGQENLIWSDIKETYNLSAKKAELDSLLNELSKNAEFRKYLENQNTKIYISTHFSGHNRFENIYSLSLTELPNKKRIEQFLKKKFQVSIREFNDEAIYEIRIKDSKQKYFITVLGGVISITTYAPLTEKLIISSQKADPSIQNLKNRLLKLAGKDNAVNLYINYKYFYRLLSKYTHTDYSTIINSIGSLSQFAALDIQLQDDRISLSGYSIQSDSFPSFLSSYQNHPSVEILIPNILPSATSFMVYQGAENIADLLKERGDGKFSEQDNQLLERYKAKYLVNMEDYFYHWMKSELAFAQCNIRTLDIKDGAFAIIECTDLKEANQSLSKLGNLVLDHKNIQTDTSEIVYRSYIINKIELSNLLPALFGSVYSNIENTYYTSIDNYIVFANKPEALHYLIDRYIIEQVLSNSDVYKNALQDVSTESNVLVYANMHLLKGQMEGLLSKEGNELKDLSGLAFNNFSTFAIEYIANDEGIYTTFALHHSDKKVVDEPISWKTALDNPIARGPFWIKNHNTNNREVIVFDKSMLMYRIDQNGSIAWAVPVIEYPMSDVYLVDFFKNGKYQYLFNSKNYIYLYDLNGNRVANYPIKLPIEASGEMSLIDYDHNKNYRILIPLTNGKVYNYKIEGIETPGWKYPSMKQSIKEKVQCFRLGSKDFLVVSDTSGNVIYANRRGEPRMDAQLAFTNNTNTAFYKNSDVKPARIITTDLSGRIISIDAAGKVDKLKLREFTSNHSFNFFDFNGDKREDYIFLDENVLYVFNHRNKLILQKEFECQISSNIVGVKMSTQDSIRLVLHDATNQSLLLITRSGRLIIEDDYKSDENFIIEEATKKKFLRLTTTYGRIVSSYLIK